MHVAERPEAADLGVAGRRLKRVLRLFGTVGPLDPAGDHLQPHPERYLRVVVL